MTLAGTSPSTTRNSLSWASVMLILGKAFQMGFGFLFWIVAARTTSVADMGAVAATVSAVMLVTQVALLGVGARMIVALGRGEPSQPVLDTGFSIVAATSLATGLGYLMVMLVWDAGAVASTQTDPRVATVFLLAAVAGTVLVCLDQAGVALGKSSGAPVRYLLGGLAAIGLLGAVGLAAGTDLAPAVVFGSWALGSCVVCLTGMVQLRRWIGYRYRGSVHLAAFREHLLVGLPHHLLTLTERVPALLVPLLVAHVVSAEATAYWYPAWMLAWVAYTVPVQVGLVQFAEGVREPGRLRATLGSGLSWALLLGGFAAILLAVLARPLLLMIGADYADASSQALRVLAIGVVPFAIWQCYNARCRASGQVREGVLAGCLVAVLICAASVTAAPHGPTALAAAWVASVSLGAVWAGRRLLRDGTGRGGMGR